MRDKIHCVLFVLDACKISAYSDHLQKTIRQFQVEISDLGGFVNISFGYLGIFNWIAIILEFLYGKKNKCRE